MIGRIQGRLLEKTPPMILLDCHGVGYEIEVSMPTFYDLPEIGSEVTLLLILLFEKTLNCYLVLLLFKNVKYLDY